MYILYWSPGSASMLPHCVLEETGLPHRLHLIETSKNAHQSPGYLAINPNGRVPALQLADGTIIWETAAIAMYLADQAPSSHLAPDINEPSRAHYYKWMTHLTNTLQETAMRFYRPERIVTDERNYEAVTIKAQQAIADCWGRIDTHLAKSGPYLLGERFSTPDIFAYMLSTWQECCPDLYTRFPAVKQLADLVGARPAIQRIVAANNS